MLAVFSIAIPLVSIASLVTNALAIRVLLSRQMRSATNIILLSLAIAHLFASTMPLPFTLQAHTFGGKRDFLPYVWMCGPFSSLAFWTGTLTGESDENPARQQTATSTPINATTLSTRTLSSFAISTSARLSTQTIETERLKVSGANVHTGAGAGLCLYTRTILADLVPVASHTASAWLMVLLAFQRYLHVCHPFATAHRLLSCARVRLFSISVWILAFTFYVLMLAEFKFVPRLVESLVDPRLLFVGVVRSQRHWMSSDFRTIYKVRIKMLTKYE